ncbi:DUF2950 domain-containing protein [Paraburkholderia diazotrophica]|uniref:DUF2950 domain-containing protein n=1 Tax=Paraburkholderia diazotrophica TaxID=667676 RepID=A0A1H6V2G4_9BURK|nr:DUF2950 domain-containing protein [Paraburkholderia diazotrophica]SEI98738.1 Protein of unknown function [Paraburkholderia diazotrophica]
MIRISTRFAPRALLCARQIAPRAALSRAPSDSTVSPFARASNALAAVVAVTMFAAAQPAAAQAVYPTPDAAASAFADALATNDHPAMEKVLGKNYSRYIPTTNIGEDDIYAFLGQWANGHQIVDDPAPRHGRKSVHLAVGTDGWTLPIPIVQSTRGWQFDTPAATDEMLTRRIGRNERAAILTSLAYVDAQHDYRSQMQHYAQKFISSPGQRDGLYWPTAPGEPESPLGPLAATMPHQVTPGEAYNGYHYRILTSQGANADGGAQSYVQDGALSKGFGLVAWPAEYGKTGVMSFIVNQNGQVYQKNLGAQTSRAATAITSFNPDSSWTATQP